MATIGDAPQIKYTHNVSNCNLKVFALRMLVIVFA